MRSLKAVLLGIPLFSAAVPVAAAVAYNETLVLRADMLHDRCPGDPVPVTKPNNMPPTTNGCGVGIFAGKLPKEEIFHECCNQHDICYGTCSEEFGDCNTQLENCMNGACVNEYEENILKDAICLAYSETVKLVLDTLGGSAFESSTEKHCDCK